MLKRVITKGVRMSWRALRAFLVAGLLAINPGGSFADAEQVVQSVAFKERKLDAPVEWYCDAGKCQGDDGKEYRCGYVICSEAISACGCTCVSVSNAPYPKGFCGDVSPFRPVERASGPMRQLELFPFTLY